MPQSGSHKGLTYRPDIDGLRAVAVILVILEHFGICATGGYIGVDVFFVISGYLISSIIITDVRQRRFSILSFYERRIRRIIPALVAMLLVCSALVYRFFVPKEVVEYGRSLIAALLSVSNITFWSESGYFDAPSLYKPLLHTWSLAVEEQFYLLFPFLVLVLFRWWPERMREAISLLTLVCFIVSSIWTVHDPSTGFFWAPLRAWELLIGTLISQRVIPAIRSKNVANAFTITGAAAILIPAFVYTNGTMFPGLAAFPVCVGAAVIISGGEHVKTWVTRLLAWRPMVFIGGISYSLYLWHWPLYVFQTTNSFLVVGHPGGRRVKLILVIVSFAAAVLSWRFIEVPFRRGRFTVNRAGTFRLAGVFALVIVGIGGAFLYSKGFPSRFPYHALQAADHLEEDTTQTYRINTCFLQTRAHFLAFKANQCLQTHSGRKQYMLLGDSHAAALWYGLSHTLSGVDLSQATVAACKPFLPAQAANHAESCQLMSKFLFGDYLLKHHPAGILLTGRWEDEDYANLQSTLEWFKQHSFKVTLIGPVMEYDAPLPRLIAVALKNGRLADLGQHYVPQVKLRDDKMKKWAAHWGVPYVSYFDDVCSSPQAQHDPMQPGGCPVYAAPDVPILLDGDHMTPGGSFLFAQKMKAAGELP